MEMLLPKGPSILGVPFHCQPGVNAGAECKLDDHDLDKNQGIWKVTQISIPVLLLPLSFISCDSMYVLSNHSKIPVFSSVK